MVFSYPVIWNSVFVMTLIDALIIGVVVAVAIAVWRTPALPPKHRFMVGPALVLSGLGVTALFYVADLITMHVLPGLIGDEAAMAAMTTLHLNISWPVALLTLSLICGGFLLARARRMQTLAELESSEGRFRGFVENTSDWVWEIDADGRNIYTNERVQDLLGFRPEEIHGRHWSDIVHPAELARIGTQIASLREAKAGWPRWIVKMRHRDGSSRYVESSADPVIDEKGELAGFRGTDRDATFATLMSQISANIVGRSGTELDERITDALSQIGQCYGVERVSLWWLEGPMLTRGHEWVESGLHGEFRSFNPDDIVPWCAARLRAGKTVNLKSVDEVPAEAPDRLFFERMGTRSTMVLPLIHQDELIGVAAFANLAQPRDWPAQTESELRLLSEQICAAFSQSEATATILRRGRDLAQSEALARVGSFAYYPLADAARFPDDWRAEFSDEQCAQLELNPNEVSFDAFLQRVHEDDREKILNAATWLLSEGNEIELQFRILDSRGEIVYIANSTRADRDEAGRVLRIIGSNRDISEQVQREESLRAALNEISELRDRLELENIQLREEVRSREEFEQIVGDSEPLRNCLDLVARVAPTDTAVLILGETGTGKELIARAIHDLSGRRDRSLISLNCTALPADLVESELFGHERGAFTGAHRQRKGRFEMADGGTLFLDEIGDLPLPLQAKLLRVIEDGSFQRVGGSRTLKVDVRLVTATNRNLLEAIDDGTFRSDLYYRINTVPIHLPPLRERPEDIPVLAHHFVKKHSPRLEKQVDYISAELLRFIQNQSWPGNIRELEHFIERSLVATSGPVLALSDAAVSSNGSNGDAVLANGRITDLQTVETEHIRRVLEEVSWVIGGANGAASMLGLPPSTLRSKMRKLGIERSE